MYKMCKSLEDMLGNFSVMKESHPTVTLSDYRRFLLKMLKQDYCQLAIIDTESHLAVAVLGLHATPWMPEGHITHPLLDPPTHHKPDLYWNIRDFVVSESLRGKGVGTKMLTKVQVLCASSGIKGIYLDAANEKLSDFYERPSLALKSPGKWYIWELPSTLPHFNRYHSASHAHPLDVCDGHPRLGKPRI